MKLIKVKKQDGEDDFWNTIPEKYRPKNDDYDFVVQSYPSGVQVVVSEFRNKDGGHVEIYTPTSNKMRYTTQETADKMQKACYFFEPILKDLKKAIPLAKKVEKEIAQYQSKIKNI